jgi:hypothetical protein
MEKVGKFLGHLDLHYIYFVNFMVITWVIWWQSGVFSPVFGILCPEKSGNPTPIFQRRQV